MCSFNITVIQIYAPTPNAEEDEGDWFQEDLQHLLELTPNIYIDIYIHTYIYVYIYMSFSSWGIEMQK